MSIVINQPAMLGDLLFIEPIVRHFHEQGHEVIWPIKDQYAWLKDYIKYPTILKQSQFEMDYELCEMQENYIPLRFATPLLRNTDPHSGAYHEHFMLDKYRLIDLPLDMWRSLTWERNYEKENELFERLGLTEGQEYGLVNWHFKDIYEPQAEMKAAHYEGHNVTMQPIPGFTLLDWTKVIINAQRIHTVETALIYMIEVLPIKAQEIHMFSRSPYQDTLGGVKNFISDKWIRHEK